VLRHGVETESLRIATKFVPFFDTQNVTHYLCLNEKHCTGSGKVIETGFEHETAILQHRQFILCVGHCCFYCLFCLDSEAPGKSWHGGNQQPVFIHLTHAS
jgi:hypothetical protein